VTSRSSRPALHPQFSPSSLSSTASDPSVDAVWIASSLAYKVIRAHKQPCSQNAEPPREFFSRQRFFDRQYNTHLDAKHLCGIGAHRRQNGLRNSANGYVTQLRVQKRCTRGCGSTQRMRWPDTSTARAGCVHAVGTAACAAPPYLRQTLRRELKHGCQPPSLGAGGLCRHPRRTVANRFNAAPQQVLGRTAGPTVGPWMTVRLGCLGMARSGRCCGAH
jgi:hypothetical protein